MSTTSTLPEDERIQDSYDERFDAARKGLSDLENLTGDEGGESSFEDQPENEQEESHINAARNMLDAKESNPAKAINHVSSVTEKIGNPVRGGVKTFLKKRGAISLVGVLLGGASLLSLLGGPGLLLVNLAEVLTDKFNVQLTSLDTRYNKIVEAKLKNTTTGVGVLKKYTTFSDTELERFRTAGITPKTDGTSILGRNKVTGFEFKEGSTTRVVTAKEFSAEMKKNGQFSNAMKSAYNMKYSGVSDSVFARVGAALGISKKKPFADDVDDKARAAAVEEQTRNGRASVGVDDICSQKTCTDEEIEENKQKAGKVGELVEGSADGDTNQASRILQENAEALAERSGKAASTASKTALAVGSSAALGTASSVLKITGPIDNACMVYGWTKTISKVSKIARAAQMARYAMIFLTTASMIKAGTATAGDVTYLGDTITKTTLDSNGNTTKSGTESFGYRYAAYGDSGVDDIAALAVAGASFGGTIQQVVNTILTPLGGKSNADSTCKFLNNPVVQVASIAVGIAGFFVGASEFKITAQAVMAPLIAIAGAFLPAMIGDMIAGRLVDSGTYGEKSMNFITSGTSGMLSKTASYGGGSILKKKQAQAYMETQKEVLASYAVYDRSTLSPLDISSRNTALGSIFTTLTPYIYSGASPVKNIQSILSLGLGSLKNILSPTISAGQSESYEECVDPDYKELGIAADPFCNPVIGIPTEYLSSDPVDVANRLITKGYVDQETGAAKGEYAEFISRCIERDNPFGTSDEGEVDDSAKCFVDSQDKADLYLYFTDKRVLAILESGGKDTSIEQSSTAPSTDSSGLQAPSGKIVSPIEPGRTDVQMTAKYGRYPSGGAHYGVDLASGTPYNIVSACDGVVKDVRINATYPNENVRAINPKIAAGTTNYVWIDCGNNIYMGYAHFYAKDLKPYITTGAQVGAGTVLFPQGNQGNSSGAHLHFQVSTVGSTAYSLSTTTDPVAYLAKFGVELPKPSY